MSNPDATMQQLMREHGPHRSWDHVQPEGVGDAWICNNCGCVYVQSDNTLYTPEQFWGEAPEGDWQPCQPQRDN